MSARKLHADEFDTDAALVRRLLATQFPDWAELPITPVDSSGTDNALYRLGDELVVRLPRIEGATGQIEKEFRWLPRLAPHLPLPIPEPLAVGEPGAGYPWRWSVYSWLDGELAAFEGLADPVQAGRDLAQFIAALQRVETTGGPRAGQPNASRGVPLATRDEATRAAIDSLRGVIDTDAATAAWEASLRAPAWEGSPVWLHGDIMYSNLLAQRGRLSAVIDFGCLVVGDPAGDYTVAWNLFRGDSRTAFREELAIDDAGWLRGRGWALSLGLIALPYYQGTNPVLAGISRRATAEVLADYDANPA